MVWCANKSSSSSVSLALPIYTISADDESYHSPTSQKVRVAVWHVKLCGVQVFVFSTFTHDTG